MNILDNNSKNVLIKGWEKKTRRKRWGMLSKRVGGFDSKDNTCKYSLQFFQHCMPIRSRSEPFQHPWESRACLQWERLKLCTDLHSQEKIFRRKSCSELAWKVNSGPPSLSSLSLFSPTFTKMYCHTPSRGFCEWVSLHDHNHLCVVTFKELEAKWITNTLADARCNNQWGRQMLKTLLCQNPLQPLCAIPGLVPQLLLIQQPGLPLAGPVHCHSVLRLGLKCSTASLLSTRDYNEVKILGADVMWNQNTIYCLLEH